MLSNKVHEKCKPNRKRGVISGVWLREKVERIHESGFKVEET